MINLKLHNTSNINKTNDQEQCNMSIKVNSATTNKEKEEETSMDYNSYYTSTMNEDETLRRHSPSDDYLVTSEDIDRFNKLKSEDLNIENSKWLENKPISVLHLDQPDRAVLKIADQRDKIQKKVFTKWVNKNLKKLSIKIDDLFEDLRDGINLIILLEIISHKKIPKERGSTRFHALQNVNRCLDFLTENNIKLVNIRPDEIVDGNPKLTLGLIWIIVLNFQISDIVGKDVIAKDALINWANKHLEQAVAMNGEHSSTLNVQDFSHSWRDGKAFLGILNRYMPDKINWDQVRKQTNKQNLQLAFNLAESEFSVTKLLDAEDVDVAAPDEKSLITYVSSLFEALPSLKQQPGAAQLNDKEKKGLLQEYSIVFKFLLRWLNQSIDSFELNLKSQLSNDYVELKSLIADLKSFRLEEYANKQRDKLKLNSIYAELQTTYQKKLSQIIDSNEDIRVIEKLWEKLDQAIHNREFQLEHAISNCELMQKQYEHLFEKIKELDVSLKSLQDQLNFCLSTSHSTPRMNASYASPKILHSNNIKNQIENKNQLAKIEHTIQQKSQEIRCLLIEANKLKEKNYPNWNILVQTLSRLDQMTIGLQVNINSTKTSNSQTTLNTSSKLTTKQSFSSVMMSPSSLNDSKSLNISSSSTSSSPNNSLSTNSPIRSGSTTLVPSARFQFDSPPVSTPLANCSIMTANSSSYSTSPSSLSSLSHNNSNRSIDMSCSTSSTSHSEILIKLDDLFRWIRSKHDRINSIHYKPELTQIKADLDCLSIIKQDLKSFRTNIECIELIKMQQHLQDTPELICKLNTLNEEHQYLSVIVTTMRNNLQDLYDLIRLVHDELHYINDMEDMELNRDWSQPGKLNLDHLKQHKYQVESELINRQVKFSRIFQFGENLVETEHPASEDIIPYMTALKNETNWLRDLMHILGIHLEHLEDYTKFIKEYNETNVYLAESANRFQNLTSLLNGKLASSEDLMSELNAFRAKFKTDYKQQIERLFLYVDKLPNFKMRKMNLKPPYDKSRILIDYAQADYTILKGEMCKIEDNTNHVKWKILSLDRNRYAEVPSVCFVLKGPDSELVDMVDRLNLNCEQLDEQANKFEVYLQTDKLTRLMRDIQSDSSKYIVNTSRSNIENLIQNVKEEIKSLVAKSASSSSSSSSSTKLNDANLTDNQMIKIPDEFTSLLDEFDNFNQTLTQILTSASTTNDEEIVTNNAKMSSNPNNEQLELRLNSLFEQFKQIVNESLINLMRNYTTSTTSTTTTTTSTANSSNQICYYSIAKNANLEVKFQQFQQIEMKSFDKEIKSVEADLMESHHQNDEFKAHLTHVKTRYQKLIKLSNLYSQSFTHLENLSKLIDDFTGCISSIEKQLAAQSFIDSSNLDSAKLAKESEHLQSLKSQFKNHERDLIQMQTSYEDLRAAMDKVRARNLDADDPMRQHQRDERQSEDLLKLESLIKQLSERWNSALLLYKARKSNLKDCQKLYNRYQNELAKEKQQIDLLKAQQQQQQQQQKKSLSNGAQKKGELLCERKQAIENCNQKAAQFVQVAKNNNSLPSSSSSANGNITSSSSSNVLNEELAEKLAQVVRHLAEFELSLAKQNALSDQIDTLMTQFVEFEQVKKSFFMLLPFMNHSLAELAELKKDDLNLNEVNYKLKLINEQIDKRNKLFDESTNQLTKLNSDQTQFIDWLSQIESQLTSIDKQYRETQLDLNRLKQLDTDLKSIEGSLYSHQADLRYMKITYQIFTQQTEEFSKELKHFNSKIKDNKLKRLSTDLMSDLNRSKETLLDIDTQYGLKSEKFTKIKEMLNWFIELLKEFNQMCAKLNQWLTDLEQQVESELTSSGSPTRSVKELEEQLNKFQTFRTLIQSESSTRNEIKRCLNNILRENHSDEKNLTQLASNLFARLDTLEQQVKSKHEKLNEEIARTRDLKELLDATLVWLNELDLVHSKKTFDLVSLEANTSRLVVKDDQFDLYDRLCRDLKSRRDLLVAKSSSNHAQLEHLVHTLDLKIQQIETKHSKARKLQKLLGEFNQAYEQLAQLNQTKRTQMDAIRSPKQAIESIERLEKIKSELDAGQIGELVRPKLDLIKSDYYAELIGGDKLKLLEQDLADLTLSFEQLTQSCALKINDLNHINECMLKFDEMKQEADAWLKQAELKTLKYEPISLDLSKLEAEMSSLASDLAEYEEKQQDLNEINRLGNLLLTLLVKYDPKVKQSSNTKRYKRSNTLTNVNDVEHTTSLVDNEIPNDLNKLNQLYEWLGERLVERKKDLEDGTSQIKSYLDELQRVITKLSDYEAELSRLNGEKFDSDKVKLSEKVADLRKLDSDLSKLNTDIDLSKKKFAQFIDKISSSDTGLDSIRNDLNRVNERYSRLSTHVTSLKERLDVLGQNLALYEQNRSTLGHNLEQKAKMLQIIQTEQAALELVDTQLKQLDLIKQDLTKKDLSLLDALNQSSEYLIEACANYESISQVTAQINSDYDLLNSKLNSTLEFKLKLRDLYAQFGQQREVFYAQLSQIDADLNKLNQQSEEINSKKEAEHVLADLDRIELTKPTESLTQLRDLITQLTDLFKLNSVETGLPHSNEFDVKQHQMTNSLDATQTNLDLIKAKYAELIKDFERKEKELEEIKSNEQNMRILNELQSRIVMCNAEILKLTQEFETKFKPSLNSISANTVQLHKLEHEKYSKDNLSQLKCEIDFINVKSDEIFSMKEMQTRDVTSLELQLDKLNLNYTKFEAKLSDRLVQLEQSLYRAEKFENKLKLVNELIAQTEAKLAELNAVEFDFENLDEIDAQLSELTELQTKQQTGSQDLDEFKEICEQIMEGSVDERSIVEKRMDTLITKWTLLARSLDERKLNLNFLNLHLKQLSSDYSKAKLFVDELNLKFTSNLELNCIEPIVIKCQYEKMKDLADLMERNLPLVSDLKADASNLLTIHLGESNNKLSDYLPKTISKQQLTALSAMMNKQDIESKVNEIERKYTDYKYQLDANLDLMQRLRPLCEKFSQTLAQLNQSVRKYESELAWLAASNDNESSVLEKEELLNDLRKNVTQNSVILLGIENSLSSRIMQELMSATQPIECDEFVADLNENIAQTRASLDRLGEGLDHFDAAFKAKQKKLKELCGEMNDLLEWLDEVEAKTAQPDAISYEPDVLVSQIDEAKSLIDEINKQKVNLKQLGDKCKSLVRGKLIEDSIELKEKLNALQVQSHALSRASQTRLNELEQALAISQTFYDAFKILAHWFEETNADLTRTTESVSDKDAKESIKSELHVLKQIDRGLQEKKSDFETFNKNGALLIRLCNKNNSSFEADKDCMAAQQLKELMHDTNEKYDFYKKVVTKRRDELESLLWKSAEFADKLDNLASNLNASVEQCEYAEAVSAHPDKLRSQIEDMKLILGDLDKRKQALDDLKEQRSINLALTRQPGDADELNADKRLKELFQLWHQLRDVSDLRFKSLSETLDCAEQFWSDFHNLGEMCNDLEDRVKQIEQETVAMDPDSVIEQQQHQEQIVREIDENETNVSEFKENAARLLDLCGESEHAEVEKTVEELEHTWLRIKQMVQDREIELQTTFGKACEFQQELIEILEWITLQNEKFINLDSSFTSKDPTTIRFQINLLKEFKEQIDPQQIRIQLLNQKFNELKTNTKTNQSFDVLASLQEPLNSANKEWKRLQNSIIERKSNLQNALLDMGQFNEALDEMLKWLERTDHALDDLSLGDDEIDVQLAKLKVIQNDVKFQEQCVEKLKETGKNLIRNETTGKQTVHEIKQRVQLLIDNWESCLLKLNEKHQSLNNKLFESQTYECELQDAFVWLNEIESQLLSGKPFGGLPETAREQLDKFMLVHEQIESNEQIIASLISTGQAMSERHAIEQLEHKWSGVKRKAHDRKEKLEQALRDASEFHHLLHGFIGWLTETEKNLNQLRPVSRVLESLTQQIGEHQQMQKNISEHRENMLNLDKLGTHLKYFSQKQDVILIKNLLVSVQNRWEKIVSRSAERTRDLERGFKEAKQFSDTYKELANWLTSQLSQLSQEQLVAIGNNPPKIRELIAKHKEFHRQLSQTQPNYDNCMKLGRRLVDKCDPDHLDRPSLHEMINELKNKWQTLCFQSVERQKKLEEALLCSGQFRDALQSLLEWLSRVEPTLAENTTLNGDLESVNALIEDNEQFKQQLQFKKEQIDMVRKAAANLLSSNQQEDEPEEEASSASHGVQKQLDEMNQLWSRIEHLSQERTARLERALVLADKFNTRVRSCLEWLGNAEQQLKYSNSASQLTDATSEAEILEQIELHQSFVRSLQTQEQKIKECMQLGHELIGSCIPEALVNLKHSLAVVQSRWDEINQLSELKCKRLSDSLEVCKENEKMLNELLAWLQVAEATLTALEQKQIVNSLDQCEQLLADHQEFQAQMQSRQLKVERITKSSVNPNELLLSSQTKHSSSIKNINKINATGWKTPDIKTKNPKVKNLFNSWRKVWLLSMERQRKLKEQIDRLKEMERLKNFSFEEWRIRYMNWHKDNRTRITDFFRRRDRDHDGKISREEFIQGILDSNFPSTRLELEAVADIFDLDKDGFIDYKEFLATLKPTAVTKPNVERIRDEVQRQVSLCKCSKRYQVVPISEQHYRFGHSQKLRLVRILQSTVMVRVGGGWMALDEFLVKNDPCRAKGRTNLELRDQFILRDNSTSCAQTCSSNTNLNRHKSPARFISSLTSTPSNHQTLPKSQSTTSRSGASSSAATYGKRTPRSSLSQSNEVLMLAANSPMPSGTNSQSESLGASISDLSSEATSEFSNDNFSLANQSPNSAKQSTKSSNNNKSSNSSSNSGSRLPIYKKQK